MKQSYKKAFNKLEETKDQLISSLRSQNPEVISIRKNEKWSPLEQAYHLYLAESVSWKYCVKKLSFDPELETAGFKNHVRIFSLKMLEILPFKFKAPKAINDQVFPSDLNLDLLTERWDQDRIELKQFLENLDTKYHDKAVYKHAFMGRMTVDGMLEFFQFHMDRHMGHIRTIYGIEI